MPKTIKSRYNINIVTDEEVNCIYYLLLGTLGYVTAQVHCGTERWSVKTLSDSDTVKINFNQVSQSTVHEQISLVPPGSISKNLPRRGDESVIYRIKCNILGFKKELGSTGDKDIHVVIADPETNETMIAEIPDPICEGIQNTSRASQFEELNSWFSDNIGVPKGKFQQLQDPVTVILTGVGFFDFNHGQTGRADNGREIHPVLSMELAGSGTIATLSSNTFIKPDVNNNIKTTTMETTTSSLDILIMILLGAILGAVGQGIRVVIGLKKAYNSINTNNSNNDKDPIEYKRIALSLFIGLTIGAISGVLAAVSSMDLQITKSVVIAFITAGYAGTDFIEGFMNKNMIGK